MSNLTDLGENDQLDWLLQSGNYIGLFTADPTETGSVASEVTGLGYARLLIDDGFTIATGTDGFKANESLLQFATAGVGGWGTITHIGIMKSGVTSADDMIARGTLATAQIILESDVFEFLVGTLTAETD